jgi:hypothetical protein
MENEVTHKQIYDRLVEVETKVDNIDQNSSLPMPSKKKVFNLA